MPARESGGVLGQARASLTGWNWSLTHARPSHDDGVTVTPSANNITPFSPRLVSASRGRSFKLTGRICRLPCRKPSGPDISFETESNMQGREGNNFQWKATLLVPNDAVPNSCKAAVLFDKTDKSTLVLTPPPVGGTLELALRRWTFAGVEATDVIYLPSEGSTVSRCTGTRQVVPAESLGVQSSPSATPTLGTVAINFPSPGSSPVGSGSGGANGGGGGGGGGLGPDPADGTTSGQDSMTSSPGFIGGITAGVGLLVVGAAFGMAWYTGALDRILRRRGGGAGPRRAHATGAHGGAPGAGVAGTSASGAAGAGSVAAPGAGGAAASGASGAGGAAVAADASTGTGSRVPGATTRRSFAPTTAGNGKAEASDSKKADGSTAAAAAAAAPRRTPGAATDGPL